MNMTAKRTVTTTITITMEEKDARMLKEVLNGINGNDVSTVLERGAGNAVVHSDDVDATLKVLSELETVLAHNVAP